MNEVEVLVILQPKGKVRWRSLSCHIEDREGSPPDPHRQPWVLLYFWVLNTLSLKGTLNPGPPSTLSHLWASYLTGHQMCGKSVFVWNSPSSFPVGFLKITLTEYRIWANLDCIPTKKSDLPSPSVLLTFYRDYIVTIRTVILALISVKTSEALSMKSLVKAIDSPTLFM